jgi:hypothetical protein
MSFYLYRIPNAISILRTPLYNIVTFKEILVFIQIIRVFPDVDVDTGYRNVINLLFGTGNSVKVDRLS